MHVWLFLLGALVFFNALLGAYLHIIFGIVEKSILPSRSITVTNSPNIFFCDLPYTICLCSHSTEKTSILNDCINHVQLVISRISPLLSHLIQIFLIQKLFSLHGDRRRVIVCALWIASLFTFIGITICIHWSSCYHSYISYTICVIGTFCGYWQCTISWWFVDMCFLSLTIIQLSLFLSQKQIIKAGNLYKSSHKRKERFSYCICL